MDPELMTITPVARRLVEDYLGAKAGERFLVVVDTLTSPEIPAALMAQAAALGCEAATLTIAPRTRSGQNPPPHAAAAMQAADIIVAAASTSLYHTQAKADAQRAGARGVLNAPYLAEAWVQGAMTADFRAIRPVAERLRDLLKTGRQLRLTSPAGTDLTATITGRKPVGWLTAICREPGQISALPGGEVSLPPVEGTAEGCVVFEQVMSDLGRLERPLELFVQAGHVTAVRGGSPAQAGRLNDIVQNVPNATNIAEIGIGLNPKARLTDQITETKKRLGTAHVAIGDNARDYGGSVECAVHLDGMILDVTIALDGLPLVEHGRPVFYQA
jgi:leucyl aminopeptidase (aminopeptidase T)